MCEIKIQIRDQNRIITTKAEPGSKLSDILAGNGFYIDMPCGGNGTCGKCRVSINGREELACRYKVMSDISVVLPETKHSDSDSGTQRGCYETEDICLALDTGTTTLAMALVSLRSGKAVRVLTCANSQRMFGADIMARIEYCRKNGVEKLQKAVIRDIDRLIERLGIKEKIPLFVATDQEGGIVNRLSSINERWHNLPGAREMRHMDTAKIHSIAQNVGHALNEYKINMNLAPVLDPSKDNSNKNSFMEESRRSWGNDSSNAYKVRTFVNGMKENGVVCVSKHYPGYDSWTNSDSQIAVSASPKEKIEKNAEFFGTLANDIPATMMSSVHFLRISDRPAVFDANIVKMARRKHPDMVVITDDLWGTSLRVWASGKTQIPPRKNYPDKDFKRLVTAIIDAGNDILMISYTSKAKNMLDIMMNLSEKSSKYKRRIEESAARILKLKYKAGILKP